MSIHEGLTFWRSSSPLTARSVLVMASVMAGLLLIAGPVQAQTLHWGLSAGATSGAFAGDASAFAGEDFSGNELPAQYSGRRTGFGLGVTLRAELTPWLAAQTALRYEQRGGVVERDLLGPADGPVNETAEYKLDYLTVPLLAEARVPQRTVLRLQPLLYAGPALGVNLRSRVEGHRRTLRGERTVVRGVETPPVAVSMVTGLGASYPLPNGGDVALDLRYSYGLTNVATGGQSKHVGLRTIQAGVRYDFP